MRIGIEPDWEKIDLLKKSYLGKNVTVKYGLKAVYQKEGILEYISSEGISVRYNGEKKKEAETDEDKKKESETSLFLPYRLDIDIGCSKQLENKLEAAVKG